MRITFALTSRLMMIIIACSLAIVALLLMLGFELGLRQAHEDAVANDKGRGDAQQAAVQPSKDRP